MKVETKEAIIHVIVATAEWGKDQLRYRRHRLAEFLAAQEETKEVIWVCPAPRAQGKEFQEVHSGIRQFAVKDLLQKKCFVSDDIQMSFTDISSPHYSMSLHLLLQTVNAAVYGTRFPDSRCCLRCILGIRSFMTAVTYGLRRSAADQICCLNSGEKSLNRQS